MYVYDSIEMYNYNDYLCTVYEAVCQQIQIRIHNDSFL